MTSETGQGAKDEGVMDSIKMLASASLRDPSGCRAGQAEAGIAKKQSSLEIEIPTPCEPRLGRRSDVQDVDDMDAAKMPATAPLRDPSGCRAGKAEACATRKQFPSEPRVSAPCEPRLGRRSDAEDVDDMGTAKMLATASPCDPSGCRAGKAENRHRQKAAFARTSYICALRTPFGASLGR